MSTDRKWPCCAHAVRALRCPLFCRARHCFRTRNCFRMGGSSMNCINRRIGVVVLILGIMGFTVGYYLEWNPGYLTDESRSIFWGHSSQRKTDQTGNTNTTDKGYRKRLPKAVIIGAKKAGTRALVMYLRKHPAICMPNDEIHFFDHKEIYEKGLGHYRKMLDKSHPEQITMEKSPNYFSNDHVPQRMYTAMGPNMKFLLILRDPVDRVLSDYHFMKGQKKKREMKHHFEELVLTPETAEVNPDYQPVKVSRYDECMGRWLQYYPLQNFFIIENEDLKKHPGKVMRQVEKFLGIKLYFGNKKGAPPKQGLVHHYNKMKPETRKILVDYFRPHSLNFFKLVNRTFDWQLHWKK